jgi:DNA repair protein RecO (recombination protein O)
MRRRAIVLDRTKLGEQDLILTMLSVEGEQLRVVAKGARKPGARLAARTELFCDVDMLVSAGRGLGMVSEAQVIDAHEGVRSSLEALSCA